MSSDRITTEGPAGLRPLPTIMVLGLVSAMGSMAIHVLAPALPLVQQDLAIGTTQATLLISVYLMALGISQLLVGPVVDRWGRKQVLYLALALYFVGSLAAVIAPSFTTLLGARVIQAAGGASGLVAARALVVDIFGTQSGSSHQARLMMIVLISPAISPLLGAYIATFGGWRSIFVFLSVVAVVALIIARRFLRPLMTSGGGAGRSLVGDYGRLARNRSFLLGTCSLAAGSSALYMFLSSGAFILEGQFGLDQRTAGACFLAVAVASIAGTQIVRPVERRIDAMMAGCGLILAGSLLLTMLSAMGFTGPLILLGSMLLLGLGAGVTGPAAIHNAVSAEAGLAGTGASLAGSVQMLVSGAATIPVGWFSPLTSLKLGEALCVAALIAFGAATARAQLAAPRHRPAPEET